MENAYRNLTELKDFVEKHHLGENLPNIRFMGKVSIKTAKNELTKDSVETMLIFDDVKYGGRVWLLDNNLDPLLYPTEFTIKYQTIRHVEEVFLLITGTHNSNPNIGKYKVKIVPISPVILPQHVV